MRHTIDRTTVRTGRIVMEMFLSLALLGLFAGRSHGQNVEKDTIATGAGPLEISFFGHATMMAQFNGVTIHIDPVSAEAEYAGLPKADMILVTHEHGDHLDLKAIRQVMKSGTEIVWTENCQKQAGETLPGLIMRNGDTATVRGVPIEAVPAYNIEHMRSPGQPYHPRGVGNGYILTFGDIRVYIAGDTENTPELKALENVDVAFLPVNLPYTMSPEMAADAARAIHPDILYPYHYGETDLAQLAKLLAGEDIEIRVRNME
jgi:L-ascorbate metabolism protein UlaG (beta-lactamase superfamily)